MYPTRMRANGAWLGSLVALVVSCGPPAAPPVPPASPPPVPTVTAPPASASAPPPPIEPRFPYPKTRVEDIVETLHGVTVHDPYRWLEDATQPAVKDWMTTQDTFARARLGKLPEREKLAVRLKDLFYTESVGVPQHRGNRYFWTRREATAEKAIVYWKEGKTGKEKVLLDPLSWAADGSISLGGYWVTWDGKTVAYKTKVNNSDEATLFVMDVATGKKSEVDTIVGAKYATVAWTPRGDGFYYVWLPIDPKIPTPERPGYAEIRFHKLGNKPEKDAIVHEKTGDPKTVLGVGLSLDGRWLFAYESHGWTRTDISFRDTRAKDTAWKELVRGVDADFDVDAHKDVFYIKTNDGAPRYRMMRADPAKPARAAWTEIVKERADATLRSSGIVGGRLSLLYLKDVVSHLEVAELDGQPVREVALPAIGSAGGVYGREDEDVGYFTFNSFTYPNEIYEVSMKTGTSTLWFRQKVPVQPEGYAVEQIFARSKDGTRVPMFVVRGKDRPKDGTAPLLLYGYGGFRGVEAPSFRASIYPWLERGGTYAVVNLRGGAEFGEEWHRAGMTTRKQNVFDDFAAAAEKLHADGYSKPARTVIFGGSNGGLLVGAAMTQRPELFRVVLCDVPLLDMVRYHRFGSGKTWIEEYGSAEDPAELAALHAYSPYHRVKPGTKYPSVLLLSADSDDRVDPMHARKFAALLQASSQGGPVLLRIERNAGHGGADLVKAWVEKLADEYAFALDEIER